MKKIVDFTDRIELFSLEDAQFSDTKQQQQQIVERKKKRKQLSNMCASTQYIWTRAILTTKCDCVVDDRLILAECLVVWHRETVFYYFSFLSHRFGWKSFVSLFFFRSVAQVYPSSRCYMRINYISTLNICMTCSFSFVAKSEANAIYKKCIHNFPEKYVKFFNVNNLVISKIYITFSTLDVLYIYHRVHCSSLMLKANTLTHSHTCDSIPQTKSQLLLFKSCLQSITWYIILLKYLNVWIWYFF